MQLDMDSLLRCIQQVKAARFLSKNFPDRYQLVSWTEMEGMCHYQKLVEIKTNKLIMEDMLVGVLGKDIVWKDGFYFKERFKQAL